MKGEVFAGDTGGVQQVPRLANPIHRLYNTGGFGIISGWHPVGVLVFSVTRRSRSDESHSLTYLLDILIDFTDVTLVSDDTYRRLY